MTTQTTAIQEINEANLTLTQAYGSVTENAKTLLTIYNQQEVTVSYEVWLRTTTMENYPELPWLKSRNDNRKHSNASIRDLMRTINTLSVLMSRHDGKPKAEKKARKVAAPVAKGNALVADGTPEKVVTKEVVIDEKVTQDNDALRNRLASELALVAQLKEANAKLQNEVDSLNKWKAGIISELFNTAGMTIRKLRELYKND